MNFAWTFAYLAGFFASLCLGFAFASSNYITNKFGAIAVAVMLTLVALVFLSTVTFLSQSIVSRKVAVLLMGLLYAPPVLSMAYLASQWSWSGQHHFVHIGWIAAYGAVPLISLAIYLFTSSWDNANSDSSSAKLFGAGVFAFLLAIVAGSHYLMYHDHRKAAVILLSLLFAPPLLLVGVSVFNIFFWEDFQAKKGKNYFGTENAITDDADSKTDEGN